MSLDKADDEENRRRTLLRTSRIFRGVQRSIKTFIAFALAAYDHIRTSFNQLADPAAVLVFISHPVGWFIVDKYGAAPLDSSPHVGAAAGGMNPLVSNTEGRAAIDPHIRRPLNCRANYGMRAGRTSVRIRRRL